MTQFLKMSKGHEWASHKEADKGKHRKQRKQLFNITLFPSSCQKLMSNSIYRWQRSRRWELILLPADENIKDFLEGIWPHLLK